MGAATRDLELALGESGPSPFAAALKAGVATVEEFVQDVLRAKARARERWIVGVPSALVALLGLVWLARSFRKGA